MSERAVRARTEAWNAAQWLARMVHSYAARDEAAAREEIALDWDAATRRLVTPEVAPGIRVGLTLPTLVLQFEERGRPSPHPLDLDDKSSAEVEAWLLIELLHRGFAREAFSKRLPYTSPDMMSGDATKYTPHDLVEELACLTRALQDAAAVLEDVAHALGSAWRPTVSPERFDIGLTSPLPSGERIRIAFTPAGEHDPRPYYRVGHPPIVTVVADSVPRAEIVARLLKPFEAQR